MSHNPSTALSTILALSLVVGCATLPDPATLTPEQRQIRIELSLPPAEAFRIARVAFVWEAIPLARSDPMGQTITSAPVELASFGVIKDVGVLRATIIATDSGSAVILNGDYTPNIDATWRRAASGVNVDGEQREITSADNTKAAKAGWEKLGAIAVRLRENK